MRFRITIGGTSPIIHHSASDLDGRSDLSEEIKTITRKTTKNRTRADDDRLRQLEAQRALWVNHDGQVAVPAGAIRSCIEAAARKLRQGPLVRGGMVVESVDPMQAPGLNGKTLDEIAAAHQFTVPVVVQRNRIMRTRAKFDDWAVTFVVDCDDETVEQSHLLQWLDIGGRMIGLGDWRPEKSGMHGRFAVQEVEIL